MKRLMNMFGFTLIELLLVTFIVGLLVAILMPCVLQYFNLQWTW